tara:strand:- start:177 stop:428 length:252 start_codon:yes stop_codon:yes gene_type:complete
MLVNYKLGAEISETDLLQDPEFKRGFADYKNNVPFKEYANVNLSWAYERGRLFAASNPALDASSTEFQTLFHLKKGIRLAEII